MKDNYDFSNAVKNPFAGKLSGKYSVTVHYDISDILEERRAIEREVREIQDKYKEGDIKDESEN
ncbi:MAG: hypothetical protein LBR54_02445 [Oscillospiraceae bacterium]|jgi:hypothetical protein|nr:hypothetical protein [Oscillospiraceae bacterium]